MNQFDEQMAEEFTTGEVLANPAPPAPNGSPKCPTCDDIGWKRENGDGPYMLCPTCRPIHSSPAPDKDEPKLFNDLTELEFTKMVAKAANRSGDKMNAPGGDGLMEILNLVWRYGFDGGRNGDDHRLETTVNEAREAIIQYIEGIIGEDEPEPGEMNMMQMQEAHGANRLKASQRKKLV